MECIIRQLTRSDPKLQRPDIYYPASKEIVLKSLDSLSRRFQNVLLQHNLLFIPVNTGSHWTMYVVDARKSSLVTFFDPVGNEPDPNLWNALKSRYTNARFHVMKEQVQHLQYDAVHCGAWCISFMQSVLQTPPGTLPSLKKSKYHVATLSDCHQFYIHVPSPSQWFENAQMILEVRQHLRIASECLKDEVFGRDYNTESNELPDGAFSDCGQSMNDPIGIL